LLLAAAQLGEVLQAVLRPTRPADERWPLLRRPPIEGSATFRELSAPEGGSRTERQSPCGG
jgi:hypothetical protein